MVWNCSVNYALRRRGWRVAPVSKNRAPGILWHLRVAQIHMARCASLAVLHVRCADGRARRADAKSI
ncbi:hypothetical protein A2U01_0097163 [Trifolium medium]|uniref:Uncharacterized protein n=1 Tax=Trifolium medium TaxID=97028 RepID=A0A392UTF2_9FABA|nr:hypothetical protein [Trifolium medium]